VAAVSRGAPREKSDITANIDHFATLGWAEFHPVQRQAHAMELEVKERPGERIFEFCVHLPVLYLSSIYFTQTCNLSAV
jgi:hypothetical protein